MAVRAFEIAWGHFEERAVRHRLAFGVLEHTGATHDRDQTLGADKFAAVLVVVHKEAADAVCYILFASHTFVEVLRRELTRRRVVLLLSPCGKLGTFRHLCGVQANL